MWYEILVPCSALFLFTSLPSLLMPMYEEWLTTNKYYKDTDDVIIKHFWFKDLYLTGHPCHPTPIDAIPDLPEVSPSAK